MMVVVGLAIAAIGFACLIGFLWTDRQPYRLDGAYRVQCRICGVIDEVENPTLEELRARQRLFGVVHERCRQEMTGP